MRRNRWVVLAVLERVEDLGVLFDLKPPGMGILFEPPLEDGQFGEGVEHESTPGNVRGVVGGRVGLVGRG